LNIWSLLVAEEAGTRMAVEAVLEDSEPELLLQ
jgi:hypothetical protein